MSFFAVDNDTVIIVNPKAGSMSMMQALEQVNHLEVTAQEALSYSKRVLFIRHPITRLKSLFNMFYRLTINSADYAEYMPVGTIRAHGARAKNVIGDNDHHFSGLVKALSDDDIAAERLSGLTDDEIELTLNNRDYRRFVDFILSGNKDNHWQPQTLLSSYQGELVANTIHKFEDINIHWQSYVSSPIPIINSWPTVDHINYRLKDLRAYYADDIALWSTL